MIITGTLLLATMRMHIFVNKVRLFSSEIYKVIPEKKKCKKHVIENSAFKKIYRIFIKMEVENFQITFYCVSQVIVSVVLLITSRVSISTFSKWDLGGKNALLELVFNGTRG